MNVSVKNLKYKLNNYFSLNGLDQDRDLSSCARFLFPNPNPLPNIKQCTSGEYSRPYSNTILKKISDYINIVQIMCKNI